MEIIPQGPTINYSSSQFSLSTYPMLYFSRSPRIPSLIVMYGYRENHRIPLHAKQKTTSLALHNPAFHTRSWKVATGLRSAPLAPLHFYWIYEFAGTLWCLENERKILQCGTSRDHITTYKPFYMLRLGSGRKLCVTECWFTFWNNSLTRCKCNCLNRYMWMSGEPWWYFHRLY